MGGNVGQFFARDYTGSAFVMLGPAHLVTLGVVLAVVVGVTRMKGASEVVKTRIRWGLAIALWLNEIGWHVWNAAVGQWTLKTMLPLHVCSALVWLGGYALVTRNRRIYEVLYFLGIAGAVQALLTPDLGIYGFPHYRFFQTFLSHGLIVVAALALTVLEGMRPTWRSMLRVMVTANVYMLVVFFINSAIGSNYMYVNRKPDTASLIDLMPAWPWYLPWLELLGLVLFVLLYLPFAISDARARRAGPARG
jgi:hypothetical integral membrane protein (TIGR02206 family)